MKKKLLVLIFSVIVIGIIVLVVMENNYDQYKVPDEVIINLNENKFMVYEKHSVNDLIKDINTEMISDNKILEYEKIGKYTYTLEYKYKKRKYKYDIYYEVIDATAPVFISAPGSLTMEVSDPKEICEKIVFADNYDNKPVCSINGEYDKSVTGVYDDLEYVVSDKAGNENKKKFKLTIVDKIKNNNGNNSATPKYLYMNEILKNYKNENTSIGIDVSKWQGKIDFKAVKEAGIEFVIMRIGSQREPGDEFTIDTKFQEYYRDAKEVGLKIGVYVYNTAISKADGIKTARWVMQMLDGDKLDFPIAYDFENWSNFMDYEISLHTLSEAYKVFEKELRDNGYEAMLYSSKFYLENVWLDYEDTKVWLAHYTSKTDYQGDYIMWQMTSLAKIKGITENTVDINILYK